MASFTLDDIENQVERLNYQIGEFEWRVIDMLNYYELIAQTVKSTDDNLSNEIFQLIEVYTNIKKNITGHFETLCKNMESYVDKSRGNISNVEEGIKSSNSNLEGINSEVSSIGGTPGRRVLNPDPSKFY